jgi:hypothetical protein
MEGLDLGRQKVTLIIRKKKGYLDVLWAEQRNRVDFVHTKIIDGEV